MGEETPDPRSRGRRSFLANLTTVAMLGALGAAYGTFATFAGRFLFPARRGRTAWMFVTDLARMGPGDSLIYRTPAGAAVAIARQGRAGTADDFIALSSTCPHLGCQVHWEAQNHRFFCPCHNGAFDARGRGVSGPPAEAGQSLPQYPLKVEKNLLYIGIPAEQMAAARAADTG